MNEQVKQKLIRDIETGHTVIPALSAKIAIAEFCKLWSSLTGRQPSKISVKIADGQFMMYHVTEIQ